MSAYVIEDLVANSIQSTSITSQNITSTNIQFQSLVIDANIQPLDPDAENYDYTSLSRNYSDIWRPSWSAFNKSFDLDKLEAGAVLSSGKVSIVSSFDVIDVQKTYIATDLQYNNGTYFSNVIEPFYVTSIKFFRTNALDLRVFTKTQTLDMQIAILTSTYKVIDKVEGTFINAKVEMYTPRHIPYSIMQTVTVQYQSGQNLSSVLMFHEVYAKENLKDITYNNNILHHEDSKGQNTSIYVLSGKGYTSSGKEVAFASCYVIEDPTRVTNLGFNVFKDTGTKCYNKFEVDFSTDVSDVVIHVFSCVLTNFDFEHPLDEAKRIVMTVYLGMTTPLLSMSKVRSDHVLSWNKLWKTDLVIIPKVGLPVEKENEIVNLNRIVKTALYNTLSNSRDNFNISVNSNSILSILDVDGTVINDGDLWIIPMMVMLKPETAKAMLEFRYNTISLAQKIAGNYGYNGGIYLHVNSYTNTDVGQWNVLSPLAVFNNGLIAINVWNYYRITKDKDWLISRGYPILKTIADFLIEVIEFDPVNNVYHLNNVVGLNGAVSNDNTFTNNMAKLALGFAIEASYELTYFVKTEWSNAYYGLRLFFIDPANEILKLDSQSLEEDMYNIIEMFFILTPYYSRIYFNINDFSNHNTQSIKKNIDYYINKINTRYAFHPYNIALLTILYGLYAQYDESFVQNYQTHLYKFTDTFVRGIWNNMTYQSSKNNSLNLNAMLILIVAQGVMELTVAGGVAETRFYYEEMRLKAKTTSNMPSTWNSVRLSNVGSNKTTFTTKNKTLYIASTQT